jgi:hypothetical protein
LPRLVEEQQVHSHEGTGHAARGPRARAGSPAVLSVHDEDEGATARRFDLFSAG